MPELVEVSVQTGEQYMRAAWEPLIFHDNSVTEERETVACGKPLAQSYLTQDLISPFPG